MNPQGPMSAWRTKAIVLAFLSLAAIWTAFLRFTLNTMRTLDDPGMAVEGASDWDVHTEPTLYIHSPDPPDLDGVDGRWFALRPSDDGRRMAVEYGPAWDAHGCRIVPSDPPAPDGWSVVCDGPFDTAGRSVPRTGGTP